MFNKHYVRFLCKFERFGEHFLLDNVSFNGVYCKHKNTFRLRRYVPLSISYKRLWHLLLDKGLNKSRLRESGIHSSTIAKLDKGEAVSTDTIEKLCALLNCQPGDIMEYVEG